ncbi:LysM peptidoglycan-binding domain-containing protein [Pseudolysobacter antarcticus]|uniref:LysM peptidoglycan-binding domain-containing protein n=1 Tax=Pseudolysobacter antarcticus TaxID=2511995 RepID=A0A411HLF9_9GAMM|nr:peptidoglycan DD-metalloendopeptidase family protein [Pseudolysobacter antarcticus]QBB71355.1 LysM peptidoglycan-binding domain-containing protein [Pseudolysobacter antarcticus]
MNEKDGSATGEARAFTFVRLIGCVIVAAGLSGCGRQDVVSHSPPGDEPHVTHAPVRSGVAAPAFVETYRVVKGDTLFGIAFRHGVDYRDLAEWNGIAAPYKIYVGRELKMGPAGSAMPASSVAAVSPPPSPSTKPLANNKPDIPPPSPNLSGSVSSTPAAPATSTATAVSSAISSPQPASTSSPVTATTAKEPATSGGTTWRWPSKGAMISGYVAGDQTRQGVDIAGKAGDPVTAAADGNVVYSGNGLVGYGELIIIKHNDTFLSAYGHNRKRLVEEGQRVTAGQQIAEMGSSSASRDMLHFEIRKNGKPINPLDYLPSR